MQTPAKRASLLLALAFLAAAGGGLATMSLIGQASGVAALQRASHRIEGDLLELHLQRQQRSESRKGSYREVEAALVERLAALRRSDAERHLVGQQMAVTAGASVCLFLLAGGLAAARQVLLGRTPPIPPARARRVPS